MDKRKYFFYKWRIENFNFCWQKTGEHLESPVFHIESPSKTSWRLWLYPRGEDDGEYISCYLFRAEGGPDIVDVNFELSVSVGESLVKPFVSFEKIDSFKNYQKEGVKFFMLRREILLRVPDWGERCTLTIGCRIFNRFHVTERFGRTKIATERISGMDVLDCLACSGAETKKAIKVKALLEADPLISINLSHFYNSLRIEIQPISCEKIKYACCKIIVIRGWDKKSPIDPVRSWLGKVKTAVWRFDVPLPATELGNDENAARRALKTFFFHYDFSYSAGVEYSNDESNDYGTDLWIENISLLEYSSEHVRAKSSSGHATAVDSLHTLYASGSFADVNIETQDSNWKAHKAVLRSRSCELVEMLKDNPESIKIDESDDSFGRFLQFLYTDKVDLPDRCVAIELYRMANWYSVELLAKKTRGALYMHLRAKYRAKFVDLYHLSISTRDLDLRSSFFNYAIVNEEEVFMTEEWLTFSINHFSLADECRRMKHHRKSKNDEIFQCCV